MNEYVERQKVIEMLENARLVSDGEFCGYNTEDIKIESIPNTDIAPVVHGRWDSDERCTACKEKSTEGLDAEKWNYWMPAFCPHCGAKMDLD